MHDRLLLRFIKIFPSKILKLMLLVRKRKKIVIMNGPHVFVNWLMWIIVYLKLRICSWASMFWNQEFCAVLYLSTSALLKSICMISAVRSLLPHEFLLDNSRPSLVGATARIILLQSYFFRFLNFYLRERGTNFKSLRVVVFCFLIAILDVCLFLRQQGGTFVWYFC